MPKKKTPGTGEAGPRTTLSPEGFFAPFEVDAVPWRRLRGSTTFKRLRDYRCFSAGQRAGHHLFKHTEENCVFMTRDNKPDDIACFPDSGKARIRATGKMVPLTDV
jgi:hypothetical protein